MNHRPIFLISLILLALAAAGCDSGRERGPNTFVRVLHAAPSYDRVAFLRVEATEAGELQFRGGASMLFEEDEYTFNVDITPLGSQTRERVHSFTQTVSSQHDYYFVLTEIDGELDSLVVTSPARDGSSSDVLLTAVHAGPTVPALDLYVEPRGTDVTAAQPWGRLGFTDSLEPRDFAPGEYELTLTAPGDPDDVVMRSAAIEFVAGESSLLSILDLAGEGLIPAGVALLRQSAEVWVDRDVDAGLRFVNAASDRGPRDVVLDNDFDAPVQAGVPFGTVSDYEIIGRAQHELKVTPEGNPGVLEVDDTIAAAGGRMHTLFVAGDPGELDPVFVVDDRRSIGDRGRIRFFNGANFVGNLDFFLVPEGGDIDEWFPRSSMGVPGISGYEPVVPGEYDIVLRQSGTENVVAGPLRVTIDGGGVYGMLALDGDNESVGEIVLFDDFIE